MPPGPIAVLLDCDPGHDDASALLLSPASPEVELFGVTTIYGNQTLEKTTSNALAGARARRPHGRAGRIGGDRCRTDRLPTVHVGVDVDAAALFDLLVERMATLG